METNEINNEINSVSDLSKILQTLGEPEKGHTRFFRGHADKDWQMLPSIYRAKHLIKNEDKIIKDALTYCPDDFSPSDTRFEKLVKLQHYGYSTRLLDLTTNMLVALYFSAQSYKEEKFYSDEFKNLKDGELIIVDIPNEEIKYGDSDTVAILSAISSQESSFVIEIKKGIKKVVEYSEILSKSDIDNILSLSNIKELLIKLKTEVREKLIVKYEREMSLNKEKSKNIFKNYKEFYDEINSIFNSQDQIIKLLQDIRTDKPQFTSNIDPKDFQRVLCVRAKLNNARISRQQGCFLLFGIGGSKLKSAAIPDEWQRLASNGQKIIVKAENKAAIMEELKSFGISKRTLFPELEAQAKEIMDYYKGQK